MGFMAPTTTDSRQTQCAKLLRLLIGARGSWVPLAEILDLKISQFGSRLWEIRHRLGLNVENRMETTADGVKLSWYRLRPSVPTPAPKSEEPPANQESLFGDLTPQRRYPD